ncbi:MAG: allophanate hydrolase [Kineosporiaceae bacterium]
MIAGLDDLGVASLRHAYDAGLPAATLADAVLDRLRALEDGVRQTVFLDLVPDDVLLAEAERLDALAADHRRRGLALPPLFGVPVGVKGNIDVAGLATTAACPAFAPCPAARDAEAVHRLRAAGALVVATTNLDQFATGLVGHRSPYGTPPNPWHPDTIPGGSSSGSGAAVALGLVSVALGTDTAGSGRVPGALTATVGVKPSRGLVSTRGVLPACRSLDCVSVHASSVADGAAVLAAIAGFDDDDPWSRDLPLPPPRPGAWHPRGLRIAVPTAASVERLCDSFVAAGFAAAVDALARLGVVIVPHDPAPLLDAGDLLYDGPWVAERWAGLEGFVSAQPDAVHPVTLRVLSSGAGPSAAEAFRGRHRLQELRAQVRRWWRDADLLLTPTVPTTFTRAEVDADPLATNARMGRWTTFTNLLDLAAVAVPAGVLAAPGWPNGRPLGVQVIGPAGSDAALAAAASGLEGILGSPTAFPLELP